MERVLLTRLKTEDPVGGPDHKLYIFRETISAEDVARAPPPAVATLARSEVSFEANPDPDTMSSLYPERAVRRNWSANVKVVCRVMPSRNLVCRDGEITFPGSADTNAPAPDNGREFILATYQITSMMQVAPKTLAGRETVGSDVIMTLAWRLPD